MINYKFKEDEILKAVENYIDQTYSQHYANGKYQATDMIIDSGHGEGFAVGNVMKYAMRFGKKKGKANEDLMKIIHYAIIALYVNGFIKEDN
tara:strand:+ start:222 stop:497 length:276 start_codon:yes stop_codon:yes gene_type:complete